MRLKKIVVICLLSALSIVGGLTIVAGIATVTAVRAVLAGDSARATSAVRIASPALAVLDGVTFGKTQTLQCWQTGVETISLVTDAQATLRTSVEGYSKTGTVALLGLEVLTMAFEQKLAIVENCARTNGVMRTLLSGSQQDDVQTTLKTARTTLDAMRPLFASDQTWVVMLQNTTELRPTGGFTGSYALVELRDQTLQLLAIEDIYDADGQVDRFRTAPPGIAEYTSGENGLRLPDANWWPDFPTSAQTQLDFLAEAGRENLVGVVAINLSLIQDILSITGPIDLPDYSTRLTRENASTILRAHAQEFFPGSRGKKQMLGYALEQLQYQLATLNGVQQRAVLQVLLRAAVTKDIQIFSTDPAQQQALQALGVTAALDSPDSSTLALIEANVGINKANEFVTRTMTATHSDGGLDLSLTLKNNADHLAPDLPASQSGYVNYQRIITGPDLQISNVRTDTIAKPTTTPASWTTHSGHMFTEQGLLMTILPGQSQTLSFRVKLTTSAQGVSQPILLWHQSGTGTTPLTITDESGMTTTTAFDHNLVIAP